MIKHELIIVSVGVVEIEWIIGTDVNEEMPQLNEKVEELKEMLKRKEYVWGDIRVTSEQTSERRPFYGKEATYYILTFLCPIEKKEKAKKAIEKFLS